MSEKLKNIDLRSEEVQEILTRVPNWMIRWGNTLFLSLIVLVLVMAWFIKYPDIIQTSVFLTTENPAEKVYARTTARIDSIFIEPNQQVFSGQPLALLENTADYSDIVYLEALLETLEVSKTNFFFPIDDLPMLFLGEVEQAYANFENSESKWKFHNNENTKSLYLKNGLSYKFSDTRKNIPLSNSLKFSKKFSFKILAKSKGVFLLNLANIIATLHDISAFCSLGGNSTVKLSKPFGRSIIFSLFNFFK